MLSHFPLSAPLVQSLLDNFKIGKRLELALMDF